MGQVRHGSATYYDPAGSFLKEKMPEGTHAVRAAIQRSTGRQAIACNR